MVLLSLLIFPEVGNFMDLLLKVQNLTIFIHGKCCISMMVWSRSIIFSQCLHSKKFSGLSEGIFDNLISDQIRGGRNKKICSKFEKFYCFAIKNSSVTFLQNPSDSPYNLS